MDKRHLAENKKQPPQQLQEAVVQHNGLKATIYMGKDFKPEPEIDESSIVVTESDI